MPVFIHQRAIAIDLVTDTILVTGGAAVPGREEASCRQPVSPVRTC